MALIMLQLGLKNNYKIAFNIPVLTNKLNIAGL